MNRHTRSPLTGRPVAVLGLVGMIWAAPGLADVVFDGSLGPTGGLSGDMVIGEEWGTREGANLFHSFLTFNIFAGESAVFTSSFAGPTDHVIARVTGGAESLIDGPLSVDIPGASLWLVNPSGLVFGEGAMVDVQGAFTATTADYLLMAEGGRFAANPNDLGGTVLTMGNPTGFGFLGAAPASIRLQGAQLTAGPGSDIRLVGGGLDLQRSHLSTEGGRVELVSVSSAGEAHLVNGMLDTSGVATGGDVTLQRSTINVDSDAGGAIRIVGGQLVVKNESRLTARSIDGDGAGIDIDADHLTLAGGSGIDTSTAGTGQAGDVRVAATDSVLITNGGAIVTDTQGRGDAGDVYLSAGNRIAISGADASLASGVFANTGNRGDAGAITIETGVLEMTGAASLEARSSSVGNGGEITITASEAMRLTGMDGGRDSVGQRIRLGTIDAGADATNAGRIHLVTPLLDISNYFTVQSDTRGSRDGGSIQIDVDDLWMTDGAQVRAETGNNNRGGSISGVGAASSITINASNDIRLSNTLKNPTTDEFTFISVNAQKGGRSGNLVLNARAIELDNALLLATAYQPTADSGGIRLNASDYVLLRNGTIESSIEDSDLTGADIVINTPQLSMEQGSHISTNTLQSTFNNAVLNGQAGSIFLNLGDLFVRDSAIEASSCGCSAGSAGDIVVVASGVVRIEGRFVSGDRDFGAAGIRSQTFGGETGGNIYLRAADVQLSNGGTISTSSPATADFIQDKFPDLEPGNAGSINIVANRLSLDSGATITTSALEAAGGVISLDVSELIYIEDASITAEALGVTPGDDGGNLFIADPSVIVLDGGAIVARANAGNGGNIGISTGALIPGLYGTIDASSRTGLDGQVVIDSPNQQVTSVTVLDTPAMDVSDLIEDPCVVDVDGLRSSLTVEGKGGLPPTPDDYQPAPDPLPADSRRRGAQAVIPLPGPVISAACVVMAP